MVNNLATSPMLHDIVTGFLHQVEADLRNAILGKQTVELLKQDVAGGAAKGCMKVMSNLTDMITDLVLHGGTVPPAGFDCTPGVTLAKDPMPFMGPVLEALLMGLANRALTAFDKHVYAPLVNKLVSSISAVMAKLGQLITGLCGLIPEAGGIICNVIMSVIIKIVSRVIPPSSPPS